MCLMVGEIACRVNIRSVIFSHQRRSWSVANIVKSIWNLTIRPSTACQVIQQWILGLIPNGIQGDYTILDDISSDRNSCHRLGGILIRTPAEESISRFFQVAFVYRFRCIDLIEGNRLIFRQLAIISLATIGIIVNSVCQFLSIPITINSRILRDLEIFSFLRMGGIAEPSAEDILILTYSYSLSLFICSINCYCIIFIIFMSIYRNIVPIRRGKPAIGNCISIKRLHVENNGTVFSRFNTYSRP